MPLLAAAVVLVGIIGLVNIVFSFGVIRRLREHTEILDRLGGGMGPIMLEPGQSIADFAAVTIDGQPVGTNWPEGPTLIGFLSPTCQPCQAKLPSFVEQARRHPGGRDLVLAVVVGDSDDVAAPVVAGVGDVARVVRDVENGPVSQAFGVRGYPAFALVEFDGRVLASGSDISAISLSPQRA